VWSGALRPMPASDDLISFPAHVLLIVEERLAEQEAEGVDMPKGMERDELALRILIAASLNRPHRPRWRAALVRGDRGWTVSRRSCQSGRPPAVPAGRGETPS
jgi:hypothetical protein